MRAVMLEVPQALLDERRDKGLDKSDEMWEGELHMVPPPLYAHQELAGRLFRVLAAIAEARGMVAAYEAGLFRPGVENDYRVPDQTYARPEIRSERGIVGAASLVVEILSPNDETYRKLDWYASVGVGEVLVIDASTRAVELFANRAGRMVAIAPVDGGLLVASLAIRAETVDGRLRLTWDGGTADI